MVRYLVLKGVFDAFAVACCPELLEELPVDLAVVRIPQMRLDINERTTVFFLGMLTCWTVPGGLSAVHLKSGRRQVDTLPIGDTVGAYQQSRQRNQSKG